MRRGAAVAVLTALLAVGGPVAYAAFGQQATASAGFSTDTLLAPSGLSATAGCNGLEHQVALSWTATPSEWADGYEVSMATSSGGPYSVVPLPIGGDPLATTRTVGGLTADTTYWFRVTATRNGWRSSHLSASAKTALICLL